MKDKPRVYELIGSILKEVQGMDYNIYNRVEISLELLEKEIKRSVTKKAYRKEVAFLQSKDIRWLIYEADLGSSHEDFEPITNRIKKLESRLQKLEER